MDPITLSIGILAVIYGLFSAVMRFAKPSFFKKLEPMRQQFGEKAGNTIHFIAYVVIPVALGIVMIIAGMKGISFFGPA